MSSKLTSGAKFPSFMLPLVGGGEVEVGRPSRPDQWQVIIIYRGFF